MASQTPQPANSSSNNNLNTTNSNSNNSEKNNTIVTNQQNNNNNGSNPLLISSTQPLSPMPGLVAAAVAGVTTLIPFNAQLQTHNNVNNPRINNNSISSTSITSSSSSGSSTPSTLSLQNNLNMNNKVVSSSNNDNSGLYDLIRCKLGTSHHIIVDPRLLECGASACAECIMLNKDSENKLKCPYCNNLHDLPFDLNKLVVNKNLEGFLKNNNLQQMNQFDDSIFTLEQKIQTQNVSMENFDQYLNLVQNDVKMKVETMKTHLEKYGEQFIENLKLIRKEVQKQWLDHASNIQTVNDNNKNTNMVIARNTSTSPSSNSSILQQHNQQQQHSILLQQQHQQQLQQVMKDKTIQFIGNNRIVNGTNSYPIQLNQFHNVPSIQITNNSNTTNTLQHQHTNNNNIHNTTSVTTINSLNNQQQGDSNKHQIVNNTSNLSNSLDVLQNTFNFSNPSNWNANSDDLEDFETDLSMKPVQTQPNTTGNGQKRHLNKEQAQFNKFVRDEVSKKFGENFLLQHEVNQLESSAMELIKNEAISSFLPKDTSSARAWTLAKVSLRSLKRDLRRKQGISVTKEKIEHDCKINETVHPYFDIQL